MATSIVPVATGAAGEGTRAVDRYEQVLRTAPPDVIEKVRVEAFDKLTPAQLDLLLERFTADAPSHEERPADAQPATLARAAAQAETRQPGALARIFKGPPPAMTSLQFFSKPVVRVWVR